MATDNKYQDSCLQNRGGLLYIGGCSALDLAREYGTPLYVYDEQRIRANYHRILDAFRPLYKNFKLYYAVKANNNLAVLRILEQMGSGVDVSSPAEIYLAKKAGFSKDRILYSGNYHSDEELRAAIEEGIKINLDDISQLERMIKMDLHPEFLSFRINPGIGGSGHEGLVFAGPNVKFGISEEVAAKAYKMAKDYGVKTFGVHMMAGSNILNEDHFETITSRLLEIVERIVGMTSIDISFIDIGGGLGIPSEPTDRPLDLEAVAKKVVSQFNNEEITLMMEPGRYIVGDAGVLLAKVHSIKRSQKTFIGIDAGMNTLLRPALYGAYHPILAANKLDSENEEKVNIVGQICENTDHLAKDRMMPKLNEGDLLAITDVGAYGFAMSSQYNTRPRAAEVLVNEGKHELIRRRETKEDIDRNVAIPPHLSIID